MLNIKNRINAFARLGEILGSIANGKYDDIKDNNIRDHTQQIEELIRNAQIYNGWFTEKNVQYMLHSIARSLDKRNIDKWLGPYMERLIAYNNPKIIAVIMAGNIPLVGFHDFLSVLISGNKLVAKLSGDDNKLLPAIAKILIDIEPFFGKMINFNEGKLDNFDAVIATGSNNTSRYFDYYFGKYPNIIRKNRNGIAVLSGNETSEDLQSLCDDIFLYYGLGCRNISKLLVPENYDFSNLLDVLSGRSSINENHKYYNNYEYNKAIYLINGTPHFDTGNLILLEKEGMSSPVSVVYYEQYKNDQAMLRNIEENNNNIQCVVSNIDKIENRVGFGQSQQPKLWDYADGIDTIRFLLSPKNQ